VSASTPVVYEIPEGPRIELDLPARLWAAAAKGTAAALAEGEWVAHVTERIRPPLNALSGDIALRLDVGLGQDVGRYNSLYPLYKNDLENYLSPIAKELPNRVVSVWATKARGECSYARVEPARPTLPPPWREFPARRACGAEDLRAAVRQAVADTTELAAGPVGLQASFVISDKRPLVSSIWKCALDGLGALLGLVNPHEKNNPLDDRIIRIGFHHRRDGNAGEHEIDETVIWATEAPYLWPETGWLAAMSEAEREDYWRRYRERLARDRARPATLRRLRQSGTRSLVLPLGVAELETVEEFEAAVADGAAIVNKSAAGAKLHRRPRPCNGVQLRHFVQTVIYGAKRNGRYYRADDADVARQFWPNLRDCASCEAIAAAE
jgi:hypothetical protein